MNIKEIRFLNLAYQRSKFKTVKEFAEKLERSPSQIGQYLNKSTSHRGKPRGIGDDFAQHVEEILDLPYAWMDTPHFVEWENAGLMAGHREMRETTSSNTSSAQARSLISIIQELDEENELTPEVAESVSSLLKATSKKKDG